MKVGATLLTDRSYLNRTSLSSRRHIFQDDDDNCLLQLLRCNISFTIGGIYDYVLILFVYIIITT